MAKARGGVRLKYEEIYAACKGKSEPTKLELLDWVFNHVGLDPTTIAYDEFPCVGAARLLLQANMKYREFLAIWAKTIPTQTQLKMLERPKDDGQILGLLDSLETPDADSPEGIQRELGIPPEDSGAGPDKPDGAG